LHGAVRFVSNEFLRKKGKKGGTAKFLFPAGTNYKHEKSPKANASRL